MDHNEQSANQENETLDSAQDWLFDAFCQPRTIPDNWDLTGMDSTSKPNGNHLPGTASTRHQTGMDDDVEETTGGDDSHNYYLNPFPEPRTYPVNWDLI